MHKMQKNIILKFCASILCICCWITLGCVPTRCVDGMLTSTQSLFGASTHPPWSPKCHSPGHAWTQRLKGYCGFSFLAPVQKPPLRYQKSIEVVVISLSSSQPAHSRGLIGQLPEPLCKVNPLPQQNKTRFTSSTVDYNVCNYII